MVISVGCTGVNRGGIYTSKKPRHATPLRSPRATTNSHTLIHGKILTSKQLELWINPSCRIPERLRTQDPEF